MAVVTLKNTSLIEVNRGGSDANCAGGFDPSNLNMATNLTATSGNTSAPVVSSASYNFVTADIGYWVFIQGGTNWIPGWYQIASVAANAATLTAGVGTAYLYDANTWGCKGFNTVAGCATTASPTVGAWSVDYTFRQTNNARYAYTDLVIDATTNTKLTSAGNPFGVNCIGNAIQLISGTGFNTGFNTVSSIAGTTATMTSSNGTLSSTAGVGYLGGALASIGMAAGACQTGGSSNVIFVNYSGGTPYSITSSTANIAAGKCVLPTSNTANGPSCGLIGYDTSRWFYNNDVNRPIIDLAVNSIVGIAAAGNNFTYVRNISITNSTGKTGLTGMYMASGGNTGGIMINCKVDGCQYAFESGGAQVYINCEASNYTNTGFYADARRGRLPVLCRPRRGEWDDGVLPGPVGPVLPGL